MSYFFKNTRKLAFVLSALLLAITLTAGSFAYVMEGFPVNPEESGETMAAEEAVIPEELEAGETDVISPGEPITIETMAAKMPSALKGAYLVPGADFVKTPDAGADTIRGEVDAALQTAKELGMTAVVIDTAYNDKVIYETADANRLLPDFDVMEYIVDKCRENGLYTFAIFGASNYADDTDKLSKNAGEFASKYQIDSVLIDGYTVEQPSASYADYIKNGGSIGFENYKRQASAVMVNTVAKAVHRASSEMSAGLLADAVWANKSDNEQGPDTSAKYTSLISGNADTKAFVERRFVDFVAVKAFSLSTDASEPFAEVVSWWSDVAGQAGLPMYVVHASSKIGTTGWTPDQIVQQSAEISHYDAYRGSIYDSLSKLQSKPAAAPKPAAQPAAAPKPAPAPAPQEPQVQPAASPAPVEVEPVPTSTVKNEQKLDAGSPLIKSVSPNGIITAEMGERIYITALAYRNADVVAMIDDEEVYLTLDEDDDDGDSVYGTFTGSYVIGESEESDEYYEDDEIHILGGLSVTASYNGRDETFDTAFMSTSSSKIPVQVKSNQAKTYPANTKDNVPLPTLYPLPKGALDYAVGKAFSYTSDRKETFTYIVLESGVRVETKDLKEVSRGPSGSNRVSGMTVTAKDENFTYVTLKTEEKITYSFAYNGDSVQIKLNNTTKAPSGKSLTANPMFTKAAWSGGDTLTLTLAKRDGFMGYKGYYDTNGNLVFRFNNPPASIKKAKIAIDPGHGGKDIGSGGYSKDYPEKVITRFISERVAAELKARGADVYLMETDDVRGPERAEMAEKWGADILISIHGNSSTNKNASGTEVYFFTPFSRQLAISSSSHVSKQMATLNRGARLSYYHVTLSSQMASVLVECGFMSNSVEYNKLLKTSYHKKIAKGIADSVEQAIKAAKTGVISVGSESSGTTVSASSDSGEDDTETTTSHLKGGGKVEELYFESETLAIALEATKTLKPVFYPENADNQNLTWKSSSSKTVSVDSKGKIKALNAGTATITATTRDGSNLKATVKVTVSGQTAEAFADSGISLNSAGDVQLGESWVQIQPGGMFRVEVLSDKGTRVKNEGFKWKSSDTRIATVDSYGIVTAKKKGYAVISAISGHTELICDVEVSTDVIAVKGLTLEKSAITIARNEPYKVKYEISPGNATDKSLTWTTSNSKIASVDASGNVTGQNVGKCTITAKSKSGNFKKTLTVTVVRDPIAPDGIRLDSKTLEMTTGSSETLYMDIFPSDATSTGVTWKSSNSSVVSVDKNGNLIALKKGTSTITVTSNADKNIKATCKITVFD